MTTIEKIIKEIQDTREAQLKVEQPNSPFYEGIRLGLSLGVYVVYTSSDIDSMLDALAIYRKQYEKFRPPMPYPPDFHIPGKYHMPKDDGYWYHRGASFGLVLTIDCICDVTQMKNPLDSDE